jgi:hypothetical protein
MLCSGDQPYAGLFAMRADGTDLRQLTDNQWEEGLPAAQPTSLRRKGNDIRQYLELSRRYHRASHYWNGFQNTDLPPNPPLDRFFSCPAPADDQQASERAKGHQNEGDVRVG